MDINKERTVAFTGHRNLPVGEKLVELKKMISNEIETAISEGYDTFLNGSAVGFDLLVLELLIKRTKMISFKDRKRIKVIVCIPFEGQADKYTEFERKKYFELHGKSDEAIMLATKYHKDCFKNRNQFMVDNSSKLIAYYNGGVRSGTGQTVRMAEKQQLNIINLYEKVLAEM